MSKPKTPEEQAAVATLKELRARDAALATREYQQEVLNTRARTERLRALRLAQAEKKPPAPPAKTPASAASSRKRATPA